MKKEELASLLRSAGVDENGVTLATNAYEIGYDAAKDELKEDKENSCASVASVRFGQPK